MLSESGRSTEETFARIVCFGGRREIPAGTTIAALHARNDQLQGLECIYLSKTMSAKIKPGAGETAYWLVALAALIFLVVGILFLAESGSTQTTDLYHQRLATEGIPNQGAVTFDQAIQMLSVRH